MVNADRDKRPRLNPVAVEQRRARNERATAPLEPLSAAERPADAGTSPSAPAPSQAATEAHSDENEALRAEVERWRKSAAEAYEDGYDQGNVDGQYDAAGQVDDLRAKVARVEALATEWIGMGVMRSMSATLTADLGRELRAALAGPATEEGA